MTIIFINYKNKWNQLKDVIEFSFQQGLNVISLIVISLIVISLIVISLIVISFSFQYKGRYVDSKVQKHGGRTVLSAELEVTMGSFLKKKVNIYIDNDIQPKPKKARKTFENPKGCEDIREMFKKAEERNKATTIEIDEFCL